MRCSEHDCQYVERGWHARPHGSGTLERYRRAVSAFLDQARAVAAAQYADSLLPALVRHLPCIGNIAVARDPAGDSGGRVPGAPVHHLSRLRSRLVFQLAPRQRRRRFHHRCPDVHPVRALALATRDPSRHRGASRQAWHRRYLDHDGARVPRRVTVASLVVSADAQSAGALCAGSAVSLPDRSPFRFAQGGSAPTPLRVGDEPGVPRHGGSDELGLRPRPVSVDSVDSPDGGGRRRRLAVLCAAPVRRCVLGARR